MANTNGRALWLFRAAAALVLLVALAGAVAFFVLRAQPKPAPTDGRPAVGTVSEPDTSGRRTYDSSRLGFRFRYPAEWELSESGAAQAPEGDYLTITLLPRGHSNGAPSLNPPVFEVVPDPQGFSADAVVRMKWGSVPATMTVTTSTLDVAGTRAVEVVVRDTEVRPKALYTYEVIATVPGRMFRIGFSSSKAEEFEAMAAQVRKVFESLETY